MTGEIHMRRGPTTPEQLAAWRKLWDWLLRPAEDEHAQPAEHDADDAGRKEGTP